jgi:CheY-like chemotaxis protein
MQVDQSLARTLGGIGIGLTLARGLIQQHGGTIRALSEGPGRGTTMVIECPLMTAEAVAAVDCGDDAPVATEALSVLVIDDNRDAAELLRSLLETKRHSVHVANDGPSGLDAALSLCPDVALIDIGLPGIDGYQVASSLRASSPARDMVLVAITGYGRPEDRARALESGFNHYIVKPLRMEELDRVLSQVARRLSESQAK